MLPNSTVNRIGQLIRNSDRILVISHIGPDGDAFGSFTATGLALEQLEKSFSLVIDDGLLSRFAYLPLSEKIKTTPEVSSAYDLILSLDCGDLERLGNAYAALIEPIPPIINIDHHITNTLYGQVNLVDSEANATAELLYFLFPLIDVHLNTDIAVCLLTGLITDTLGFRTAGVDGQTLKIASTLVDLGADLHSIFSNALIQKPFSTLLLWQKGLNNMRLEGGVLWTSISKEERQETGRDFVGSSGLGNLMADIDQVSMSAVLTESDNNQVVVSFRCRAPYSVSELAEGLGGGGHHLAAGCTVAGSLTDVERLVVSKSISTIQEQREKIARSGLPGTNH